MSTGFVPQQPQPGAPAGAPPAQPPTPPWASEATRLLCAGTYLDSGYRDRVIEELHLNEQRIAAPSLGFDAARVLAHALRARRQELLWAGAIVGLWLVGRTVQAGPGTQGREGHRPRIPGPRTRSVPPGRAANVVDQNAQHRSGRSAEHESWRQDSLPLSLQERFTVLPSMYRTIGAFLVCWWGRVFFTAALVLTLVLAFGGGSDDASSYDPYSSSYGSGYSGYSGSTGVGDLLAPDLGDVGGLAKPGQAWFALAVLAGIALCAHAQRTQFRRALAAELSPQRFPDAANDPPRRSTTRASSGSSSVSGSNSTPR
ncbi:hypothetical protein [Streptomyces sp. NPDC048282]|uniref:hypothetical protein n=1 Tax=Streptomyces sp. NPDC048282 TaxID=3365528 RepID=UPI00371DD110